MCFELKQRFIVSLYFSSFSPLSGKGVGIGSHELQKPIQSGKGSHDRHPEIQQQKEFQLVRRSRNM